MPGDSWATTGLEILRENDFSGPRLNRPGKYVVCFGAEWCAITRRFMPRFVEARGRFEGTLAIADITKLESSLWDTFQIRITPTVLVFENGSVQHRVDGRRFIGITRSRLAGLERLPQSR